MAEQVLPGLTRIGLGAVNAYLVDSGADDLVLIDTGGPMHPRMILGAITEAGHRAADVGDILVTHQHIDHAGGLAGLAAATGARVNVHPLDAPEIETGSRPRPAHGHNLMTRILAPTSRSLRLPPAAVDHELADGETLAGSLGIRVVHTPGHTAGHCAFLWGSHGGVLFAGDALANWRGRLGPAPLAEDWARAEVSIGKLAELDFDVALFGHGRVLRGRAVHRFRSCSTGSAG